MLGKFFKKPADDMNGRVPPGQSLTSRFPVLTYGPAPRYKLEDATLKISGLAEAREFSWPQLRALPQTTLTYDIHCVTHWSKLDTTWTGIRVTDIMPLLSLKPEASHVMIHSVGGYTTNLSLDDFVRPENLLAYRFDDKPLETEHGGPLRLVVPHLYFWKSAKWISGLEFISADAPGFWERNGYHMRGDPFKDERYSDD
ncbi:sulfite oxidase-like oxidoreductase [Deinococcus psychrotolerans]|uniref:Sulfite oxidase-like oxidoreductase n=1 Tax=Deinococcus psychrotolerans TaxID=2489213 RepID=A0A3G8YA66_9DEIO|nr:sulfite oxidase-like oxidoreductase [Deinococcus psychrotolerans]AZI42055.1 sulfite oxidase-like oxidoreductase [Deinococcus psychrotolerans]